ncbi:hypothetical protein Aspvir_001793 [Aspergillus viridinutans]|uniref:Major facilitator superfamily (MFS) profile domain-containing protein n=1 Tax=Aspergillus viridinutans TaxID=75553 RepID=A0A9P3C1J8_ASPVI|nr:uncharacterized protein Aspvir_001793 [Aspergillus viridinutans]GIK06150.1 hypothetical protein Aspvir_001793 [Aspergillus viridinutans]
MDKSSTTHVEPLDLQKSNKEDQLEDTPRQSTSFLTQDEYTFVIDRIHRDRADVVVEPFSMRKYLFAGLDLNIWGFGLVYYCTTTTACAIAYFLPLIYQDGMGLSQGASLCLFAPPYAAAGMVMYATSWAGDKYRARGPVIVFNAMLTLIGLPLLVVGFAKSNGPTLVGCFFTTIGANSNVPAAMAYQVCVFCLSARRNVTHDGRRIMFAGSGNAPSAAQSLLVWVPVGE